MSRTRLRFVAAALAAIAWGALALQLVLSIRLGMERGGSPFKGVVAYLGYFTVLTNLFVARVATAGARDDAATGVSRWYRASVIGCATTSILFVAIAYHLLLRTVWSPTGAQWWADLLLHYGVPAGALMHAYAYRPARLLAARVPLTWCVYPALYLVYALLRGRVLHVYPYPFIDVAALGYPRVAVHAVALLVAYLGLGYAVWAFMNRRGTVRA